MSSTSAIRRQVRWKKAALATKKGIDSILKLDCVRELERALSLAEEAGVEVAAKSTDGLTLDKQGATSMYTVENQMKRRALRRHAGVKSAINRLWTLRQMRKNEDGQLKRMPYIMLCAIIHKVLVPRADDEEIIASSEDSWATDAEGGSFMDETHFFNGMFELADVWVEEIDGDAYALFLSQLLASICEGAALKKGLVSAFQRRLRRCGRVKVVMPSAPPPLVPSPPKKKKKRRKKRKKGSKKLRRRRGERSDGEDSGGEHVSAAATTSKDRSSSSSRADAGASQTLTAPPPPLDRRASSSSSVDDRPHWRPVSSGDSWSEVPPPLPPRRRSGASRGSSLSASSARLMRELGELARTGETTSPADADAAGMAPHPPASSRRSPTFHSSARELTRSPVLSQAAVDRSRASDSRPATSGGLAPAPAALPLTVRPLTSGGLPEPALRRGGDSELLIITSDSSASSLHFEKLSHAVRLEKRDEGTTERGKRKKPAFDASVTAPAALRPATSSSSSSTAARRRGPLSPRARARDKQMSSLYGSSSSVAVVDGCRGRRSTSSKKKSKSPRRKRPPVLSSIAKSPVRVIRPEDVGLQNTPRSRRRAAEAAAASGQAGWTDGGDAAGLTVPAGHAPSPSPPTHGMTGGAGGGSFRFGPFAKETRRFREHGVRAPPAAGVIS
eukprot:PLAT7063.14.p1 GENE.PLAT7063.14~~PLAT7063.14.p1  ORF type:complete len:673 (-),score=227.14 PLAT7063.14:64-2082(-)